MTQKEIEQWITENLATFDFDDNDAIDTVCLERIENFANDYPTKIRRVVYHLIETIKVALWVE